MSSPDHIGIVTYALFNVSIPRTQIPNEWTFDGGAWVNQDGISIQGEVEFEIAQYESCLSDVDRRLITTGSILSMMGSLMYMSKHSKR